MPHIVDILTWCMIFSKSMQIDEPYFLRALSSLLKSLKDTELSSKPLEQRPICSFTLKKCNEEDGHKTCKMARTKEIFRGNAAYMSNY